MAIHQKRKPSNKVPIRSLNLYNTSPKYNFGPKSKFPVNYLRLFQKTKGYLLAGLLLAFFLLLINYFFRNSDYLVLKKVEIIGTKEFVNLADIQTISSHSISGKNIVFFDLRDLSKTLMKSFLGIKEIRIQKKYPETLLIFITERMPLAYMHNENSNDLYIVDDTGFVLGTSAAKTKEIPVITYNGALQIGTNINKDLVPAYLEISDAFKEEKVKFSSMSFYPNYARIYLDNGTLLFIGADKKIKESVQVVQNLLTQVNLSGKNPLRIDLRYDKVIVEY